MNIFLIILLFLISAIVFWALFGAREGRGSGEDPHSPEKILRRRAADLEIEEQYPEKKEQPQRRKTDKPQVEMFEEIEEDFKLPYPADEIISDTSRFRIYMRTLLNSEIYAQKGDFRTAISLYEGVNARINDTDTNLKIESNIDYLKKYRGLLEKRREEREAEEISSKGKKSNEIKFSFEGPLTIPDKIQIGITSPQQIRTRDQEFSMDKIAEEVSKKLMGKSVLDLERDREIQKYKTEIERLKESLSDLLKFKEKFDRDLSGAEKERSDGDVLSGLKRELETLKDNLNRMTRDKGISADGADNEAQVSRMQKEIEALSDMLKYFTSKSDIPESMAKPSLAESKYSASLAEDIPDHEVPEPKIIDFPDKKGGSKTEDSRIEKIQKKEDEGDEEFELLSRLDKEDDIDGLSDEDVFEKILQDDRKKQDESYEIIGEKKRDEEFSYDATDEQMDKKHRDDENFYKKFLHHEKRKKRELPILKVSYDFSRLPDEFSLSRDKNILEYSLYKYKPMLEKASDFIKKRKVKDAINYYKVVMSQNIPPEFKSMIRKNIDDLTEYLEKYLTTE